MKSFAPDNNWESWFRFIDNSPQEYVKVHHKFIPKVEWELIQLAQLSAFDAQNRNWRGSTQWQESSSKVKTGLRYFTTIASTAIVWFTAMDLITPVLIPSFGDSVILNQLGKVDHAFREWHIRLHESR